MGLLPRSLYAPVYPRTVRFWTVLLVLTLLMPVSLTAANPDATPVGDDGGGLVGSITLTGMESPDPVEFVVTNEFSEVIDSGVISDGYYESDRLLTNPETVATLTLAPGIDLTEETFTTIANDDGTLHFIVELADGSAAVQPGTRTAETGPSVDRLVSTQLVTTGHLTVKTMPIIDEQPMVRVRDATGAVIAEKKLTNALGIRFEDLPHGRGYTVEIASTQGYRRAISSPFDFTSSSDTITLRLIQQSWSTIYFALTPGAGMTMPTEVLISVSMDDWTGSFIATRNSSGDWISRVTAPEGYASYVIEGQGVKKVTGVTVVPSQVRLTLSPADIPPTPTPSPTSEPSPTPSPTAEPSPTPSPTAEPSPTPSPTAEPSPTPSPTAEPSPTPSPTAEPSPTPSPTAEPSPTPSPTAEPSPTPSPTAEPSPTPSPTAEPSPTPSPTAEPSPTPSPTAEPSPTPSPTAEPSPTPSPTAEPSPTPSPTAEPSPTPSPTAEPSPTPSPTAEPSPTPSPTAEPSPTPSPTAEPTPTAEPSPTPSPTAEPSPTPSPTAEPSPTPSSTAEPSPTPSPTAEPSPTPSPTAEPSPTPSPTAEPSPPPMPTTTMVPTEVPSPPTDSPILTVITLQADDGRSFEGAPWELYAPTASQTTAGVYASGVVGRENRIEIVDVPQGEYRLVVSPAGYEALELMVAIGSTDSTHVEKVIAIRRHSSPGSSEMPDPSVPPQRVSVTAPVVTGLPHTGAYMPGASEGGSVRMIVLTTLSLLFAGFACRRAIRVQE